VAVAQVLGAQLVLQEQQIAVVVVAVLAQQAVLVVQGYLLFVT